MHQEMHERYVEYRLRPPSTAASLEEQRTKCAEYGNISLMTLHLHAFLSLSLKEMREESA